jgi:hypothetical protein
MIRFDVTEQFCSRQRWGTERRISCGIKGFLQTYPEESWEKISLIWAWLIHNDDSINKIKHKHCSVCEKGIYGAK